VSADVAFTEASGRRAAGAAQEVAPNTSWTTGAAGAPPCVREIVDLVRRVVSMTRKRFPPGSLPIPEEVDEQVTNGSTAAHPRVDLELLVERVDRVL
jgi:hypothetical protein